MIAVDTNILVAFHRTEYETHDAAKRCLADLAEGEGRWAIPWPCVHEFLAVVTHPKIFRKPTPTDEAIQVMEVLMESPTLCLLGEGPDYWPRIKDLLTKGKIQGPRIHDARIAALCEEHRVQMLWTADRDFSRFPGLICRNPLVV